MTRNEILGVIKKDLLGKVSNFLDKSQRRVYMDIKAQDIKEIAEKLFCDMGARFMITTGADTRSHIELLYHFSFDKIGLVVTFTARLDKNNLTIDSITPLIRGAEWIEREIWELLGVNFKNHPNLKRLLLADDWPDGVYPLRRDEKGLDANPK